MELSILEETVAAIGQVNISFTPSYAKFILKRTIKEPPPAPRQVSADFSPITERLLRESSGNSEYEIFMSRQIIRSEAKG